ncbi:MAG: Asp23/Gls24 family envelope stress response protein [Clostridia bacterium]|nr:Asp23/Gls24 family envelope stress response protein [Clostridia bacterium]MBR3909537.1 Asp23/Gls24 family envelope stress response protein [Clostridia bacterium]MBR6564079.1 Asp23/Gls24 family envelope stress response protein [Clostridia bacterium]
MSSSTKLSINTDVLKKMTKIAACEIDGVVGIANTNIDLKGAIKSKNPFAGVKVESVNGALELCVYIIVAKEANVKQVAEKVQENVKDKVQTMTGTAVTKVNVTVADIKFGGEVEETEE